MWASALLSLLLLKGYAEASFAPRVEATCTKGFMLINVEFPGTTFKGVVHGNGFRKTPECVAEGDGSSRVNLRLPLITDHEDPEYCGMRLNDTSKEKVLPLIIRAHNFLETKEDKFYTIRCGPQGFRNDRNQSSFVDLQLLDMEGRQTSEAVFNRNYKLRAEIEGPDSDHTMRVGSCFSFGDVNVSIPLTDKNGCPTEHITKFTYNDTAGVAETTLTMFRFAETNRVNFQCEMIICKKPCQMEACSDNIKSERLVSSDPDAQNLDSNMVKAATTVFVVDPALTEGQQGCGWHPTWLWILTLALGILFIIMLIINLFLCASMTCMCTSTDIVEREPSVIEEYDPYRSSWHGSQCGSRYSLGGAGMKNGGYLSGASTLNSGRSVSSHSDHYAAISHHRGGGGHHHPEHHPNNHRDHHSNHRRQLSSSSSHNNYGHRQF